ncbi:MAG: hypothetical protein NVSMB14_14620 [Isosphaeraceae bacterium]
MVAYKIGEALKHVPSSCKAGYAYLNVFALLKNEAVASNFGILQQKMLDAMKDKNAANAKTTGKALKSLKTQGIEPIKDVKEFVLCAPADWKAPLALVGGNFSGKDVLTALVKANREASDEEAEGIEKKTKEGVSYLKMKKSGVLAQVAPNVLAYGEGRDEVLALKEISGGADDWDVGKGKILAVHVRDKKNNVVGGITENGDDLDFVGAIELTGHEGDSLQKDPAAFKTQFRQMLNQLADKIDKTPFKNLSDDVRGAKIEIDGRKVIVTVKLPSSELGLAIKTAAESSDSDLQSVFR